MPVETIVIGTIQIVISLATFILALIVFIVVDRRVDIVGSIRELHARSSMIHLSKGLVVHNCPQGVLVKERTSNEGIFRARLDTANASDVIGDLYAAISFRSISMRFWRNISKRSGILVICAHLESGLDDTRTKAVPFYVEIDNARGEKECSKQAKLSCEETAFEIPLKSICESHSFWDNISCVNIVFCPEEFDFKGTICINNVEAIAQKK